MTRLLLDEMYPPAPARQLRKRGHDVLAALELEVGRFPRTRGGLVRLTDALDSLLMAGGPPGPNGVTWLDAMH